MQIDGGGGGISKGQTILARRSHCLMTFVEQTMAQIDYGEIRISVEHGQTGKTRKAVHTKVATNRRHWKILMNHNGGDDGFAESVCRSTLAKYEEDSFELVMVATLRVHDDDDNDVDDVFLN